jgi:DNA-binding XRE family transcriptional regulator
MSANMFDAYEKGRKVQPRSKHTNAKMSPADVVEIRRRYDSGEATQVQLAKEIGVAQTSISKVVRRETYKDI